MAWALLILVSVLHLSATATAQSSRVRFVVQVFNQTGSSIVVDCNGDTSHPIASGGRHMFRYNSARSELPLDCVAWDARGGELDRTAVRVASATPRHEWRVTTRGQSPPPRQPPPPTRRDPPEHGEPGHGH